MNSRFSIYRMLALILILAAGSIHSGQHAAAQEGSILVYPTSGLQTTENGGQAFFTVALSSQPDSAVQVDIASSNPAEGMAWPKKLTLTPGTWSTPKTVTVTGVADGVIDGSKTYTIVLSPAFSNDAQFGGQDPPDVTVSNLDVDLPIQPPQANDDSDITAQGEAVTTDVLANDLNLGAGPYTLSITTGPDYGTAQATEGDQITYVPDPSFAGQDSYQYEVCNLLVLCGSAQVTVVVEAVNHPPVAVSDTYSIDLNAPVTVDAMDNDYDEDGDTLYLESFEAVSFYGGSVTRIDNGTPSDTSDDELFYTPKPGFDGSDTFTYSINDGESSASATVTFQVGLSENTPIANDDSYTTGPDSPLVVMSSTGVLSNDEDVNGTGLEAVLVAEPASGTLELDEDGSFTYTSDEGFSGEDHFNYKVNDGSADSNEATVTITVTEIDYTPVATDDAYTTGQLETLEVTAPGLLVNDGDANGDELKAQLISGPGHGDLTLEEDGSFTYEPSGGYVGADSFTYRAEAGSGLSNQATVTIEVLDQIPPTLSWALPILDGGVYDVGNQMIPLEIIAEDNVTVERVEIFRWDAVNEQFVDIVTLEEAPFTYELDAETLNPEWNQIFAIAYDAEDNPSERQFIWLYHLDQELLFLPLAIR